VIVDDAGIAALAVRVRLPSAVTTEEALTAAAAVVTT
jgi:hypothetical protein